MDRDIKMYVSGYVVAQHDHKIKPPIPFTMQSSADTSADAIQSMRSTFAKLGLKFGPHINVELDPSYRKLKLRQDEVSKRICNRATT